MNKIVGLFLLMMLWSGTQLLDAQVVANPCEGEETQNNMNACAEQEWRRADTELNATWKELLGHMDRDTKTELRKVQAIWLKFRDAQAAFEVLPWEGGSIVPMIQFGCLKRLTEERTGHLKVLLSAYDN